MKKKKSLVFVACTLLAVAVFHAVGCSTRIGRYVPNAQFAYPNSNITTLGPTKGAASRWSILFAPKLSVKDIRAAHNEALSAAAGANILINFKEDTTFTTIPIPLLPVYIVTYSVEGEAAQMDIGKQELE